MNDKSNQDNQSNSGFSRRSFVGAVAAGTVLAACVRTASEPAANLGTKMVPGPKQAPGGTVFRAGLVGCGGRGTGAALNFLEAGRDLQVVALADVFEDRLAQCREKILAQRGNEVAEDRCFVGFDGFQKLIDSDVDLVLLATPPYFRPEHFAAAVAARKHVFMEKPVGVDPVGIRSVLETAEKADAFGLSVVTGTQRRHERSYIETFNRIVDGAIGFPRAARCYWNQGQLWYKERQEGWSEMEHMIRDWVNWQWLSGDHIVEQHIHNIDVVNWFLNQYPVKAVGMGGRMRRVTGDQYDFFDVDFEMADGAHAHSMCRQIDGCANNVSEYVVGSEGASNCKDTIVDLSGEVIWKYESADPDGDNSPYVQEHVDLVTSIRQQQPINEAANTAQSNLVAIMGRISAYTGKEVTWDELMQSDLKLGPATLELAEVGLPAEVPVPGIETTD